MVSYRKASTSFTAIILLCSFIFLYIIIINATNKYLTIQRETINAEFNVIPNKVTKEKTVKNLLKNHGLSTLTFTESYALEKYVDGVWEEEATRLNWISPGIRLIPGGIHNQIMNIARHDSGTYRVLKRVEMMWATLNETLIAEFTIERPPEYVFPEPPRHIQYEIDGYYYMREKPVFEIWNTDYRDIYINNTYVIEALNDEQWTHFYTNRSDIIDVIKWGKIWELRITELELAVGEYRLIFQMGVEDSEEIETVTIPFTVKPRKPQRLPH